jgi:hypothetical protein
MRICHNSYARWLLSTFIVSQELANVTYLGKAVAILTTDFTGEVDLLIDGNEYVLVIVISICSPNGSTFDVKVEIATIAVVEEASFAILTAEITNFRLRWFLENKGVFWMRTVWYFYG